MRTAANSALETVVRAGTVTGESAKLLVDIGFEFDIVEKFNIIHAAKPFGVHSKWFVAAQFLWTLSKTT